MTQPDRATTAPLLETVYLQVAIAGKRVCEGLSVQIRPGQCWAILGANGVGKTTLLHTLAGLRAPRHGTVRLQGRDIATLSRRDVARVLGLMPQLETDVFPASVLETALIGRHPHLRPWQWEGAADLEIARRALGDMDLAGMEDRLVTTLSGGERRRLAAATLFAQSPAMALLDEPINHLDLKHQLSLLELLAIHVKTHNGAVALVMHDINLALRYCDHALLLFGDGESTQGPARTVIDEQTLGRLFGHPVHLGYINRHPVVVAE